MQRGGIPDETDQWPNGGNSTVVASEKHTWQLLWREHAQESQVIWLFLPDPAQRDLLGALFDLLECSFETREREK